MAKLRKRSSTRLDAEGRRLLKQDFLEATADLTKYIDDKFNTELESMRREFGDVIANLAQTIISGRTDARSIANAVARSFIPDIRDFVKQSLGQKGEGLLSAITKAQRNT
jgi:methyl-accepting chemotaxis protein